MFRAAPNALCMEELFFFLFTITLCTIAVDYVGPECYHHRPHVHKHLIHGSTLVLDHSKTVFNTNSITARKITNIVGKKGGPMPHTVSTYVSIAHKQQVVSREAECRRVLVAHHSHTELV